MARYPLYGKLVSIGSYAIPPSCNSYMTDDPFTFTPAPTYYTGGAFPQDAYGGGAAPLTATLVWSLAIIPPADIPGPARGAWCEDVWETLRRLFDTPNGDGSSGRNQVVSVAMQDGSTAAAHGELVGAPIKSSDRHAGQVVTVLFSFMLHENFT